MYLGCRSRTIGFVLLPAIRRENSPYLQTSDSIMKAAENTWSPALVEELLREVKQGEVGRRMPPVPQVNVNAYLAAYEATAKQMTLYVRNGLVAAPFGAHNPNVVLTPHNKPNTLLSHSVAAALSAPSTPLKGDLASKASKTPTAKSVADAVKLARTPKAAPQPVAVPALVPSQPPPVVSSPQLPVPAANSLAGAAPLLPKRERVAAESLTPKGKKCRVEWPSDIPTNTSLKSKSRSQVAHLTAMRVAAQQCFDPDLIFQQPPGELPLHIIFADFPKALKSLSAIRGSSGDWRDDCFTLEEETAYKKDSGVTHYGPSQCMTLGDNTGFGFVGSVSNAGMRPPSPMIPAAHPSSSFASAIASAVGSIAGY